MKNEASATTAPVVATWGKAHYPSTTITALCGREVRSSNLPLAREAFAASAAKCVGCAKRLTCQFRQGDFSCAEQATLQTNHGFVCQRHTGFFLRTGETPRAL